MSVELFIIDEARDEFERLNRVVGEQAAKGITNSEEMQLLNAIRKKSGLVKLNPAYGDKVPKAYWPKGLVEQYKLTNLWRAELTRYWRMLYTLRGDRVEVLCFVIRIVDHKRYDRLFGYRKK